MKVFVTGATGFIGSAVVKELIGAGHQVLGLTRSDASAKSLAAAGAQVHRGDLNDLESLRSGAAASDAVIHTAFIHDFSKFKEVCEVDKVAIEAIGSALAGSDRPLIVSTGIGPWTPGRPVTEDVDPPAQSPMPRVSEQSAVSLRSKGVNTVVMRLPQVHDPVKQGLVTYLINLAREKGVSAYVGEGLNRWPAGHVLDVARLYRLALERQVQEKQEKKEKHEAGVKYHAVGEEGVPCREIAEVIGRGLKIPVVSMSPDEAAAHFGWLAMFAGLDMPASSAQTQERLGWHPTGPGLIADLERMQYFAS
jgi:nucleoside-diphosphate-sugar epimerase